MNSNSISKPSVFPPDPSSLSPMEFLRYSRTPSGSKRILSSGGDNHDVDLIEMTGSPISCQVVQKLLSYLDPAMRDQLATTISKQFSDLALHPFGHQPVLALLAVGSQDQRDMLPYQLEREDILLVDLLLDKKGSFLPQASEDSFKHCYQFGVRSCGGWVSSTIFHSFSRSSSGCSLGRTSWRRS